MKKSEIKVGAVLLADGSPRWLEYTGSGDKVRVIDTGAWTEGRSYSAAQRNRETETESGTVSLPQRFSRNVSGRARGGVLVAIGEGDEQYYKVVQPGSLRGTWDDCRARREQFARARKEWREATARRQTERMNRNQTVKDRFEATGYDVVRVTESGSVIFSEKEALRLLERLEG